jgi:hypothetical protein
LTAAALCAESPAPVPSPTSPILLAKPRLRCGHIRRVQKSGACHSRDTSGIHQGHSRDTAGIQQGYSRETAGIQQGYSRDTAGIQQGYSRDTAGIQQGYSRDTAGSQKRSAPGHGHPLHAAAILATCPPCAFFLLLTLLAARADFDGSRLEHAVQALHKRHVQRVQLRPQLWRHPPLGTAVLHLLSRRLRGGAISRGPRDRGRQARVREDIIHYLRGLADIASEGDDEKLKRSGGGMRRANSGSVRALTLLPGGRAEAWHTRAQLE